ncbi:Rne/Rng family ribonuclease [Sphingomonas lenta]|uniref:Ribonuclease E n=1 Tax=Sphingomonas lenta TaxID=1141887 RepID=A0A2A2SDY8_9SPHN|nr:ribonuclease E/G [Sphingomonas lenta]PAX07433.1 ribonuclease E/G [Sphingomonas lenta]
MLIDARHREETRVAVVKGNRIEEFDFESAERKQLKGNIYLAKVTRVEPSLQAAFVDYGGNRHGFLAFSEIHPDYYQIPKEDREALLREEAEHAAEEAALRADLDAEDDADADEHGGEVEEVERDEDADGDEGGTSGDDHDDEPEDGRDEEAAEGDARPKRRSNGDDQVEALRQRRMNLRRRYKIQDVIRRRQVLLVQVVKEERGNKGAALTTYLSLAGRYCVLMPNTSHGGGISRKISNAADRKRLKAIMADLQLPPSMGCIVRTAGLQRTKTEIKRDFDYLARLWDGIREKTLQSAAPALIYGDSDLIKRAIRDIYNRDIDEIIVEGEDGYRQAREFMKMLMPSHVRRIKHYSDPIPLYQRAHVEDQLAAMYHPVVQLKSGGYLVINPTEALVSIDINSGRSTREHNIEQTATATNLEAAQEIARQLRLRDMAGLVVIDFIDMDNGSNVRKVEKAMKEALKNDRARIQVGRISSFGLMEMSRQRLRTGVLEASTRQCPHCEGTGLVRTASSAGLSALRLLEDEAARGRGSCLTLRASQEAAFYVLNKKRGDIAEIEDRYGVSVEIFSDGEQEGARMSVEASGPPPAHAPKFEAPIQDDFDDIPEEIEEDEDELEVEEAEQAARPERREERAEGADEGGRGKRRRRRRGRRGRDREEAPAGDGSDAEATDVPSDEAADEEARPEAVEVLQSDDGEGRRRRGRRGGRRRRGGRGDQLTAAADAETPDELPEAGAPADTGAEDAELEAVAAEGPAAEPVEAADAGRVVDPLRLADAEADTGADKPKRRPRARKRAVDVTTEVEPVAAEAAAPAETVEMPAPEEAEAPAKPKRSRRKKADAEVEAPAETTPEPEAEAAKPKRTRRKKADADAEAAPAAPEPTPTPDAANDRNGGGDDGAEAATLQAAQDGVVEPETAPDTPQAEAPPPRRGWWQRTFGA